MHEWAQRVRRDWRPFEEERYGGWWFGFAEGITKRADCALVVDPDADVSEVTSRYSARGLRPCVQVWPGEEAVDRLLAEHGYKVVEPTLVLARDLDERPEGPGTSRIDDSPGPRWAGRPETRILGQVHTAYGVAERDLGHGAAVLDGESVGVCAMFTEPHRVAGARRAGFWPTCSAGPMTGVHAGPICAWSPTTSPRCGHTSVRDSPGARSTTTGSFPEHHEGGGPSEPPPSFPFVWLTLVPLALVELVGLVLDVRGDLAERAVVLARVVSAEQELTAGVQQHADIGLCTTAVATVSSRERLGGGKGSSHFAILNTRR